MSSNQLSLSNIEKLIQIGNVYGNVVVKGDMLVPFGSKVHKALAFSSQPEEGLTDYILQLIDKFGKKELIDLETGLEIGFSLLLHSNPIILVKVLSYQRPNADINTLSLLFQVAQGIAEETELFKSLGIEKETQIEKVKKAFETTDTYKKFIKEDMPASAIQELLHGYFTVLNTGEYSERLYFTQHPELLFMSTDWHLANTCINAFLNSDERVVNNFMDIREYLSSFRTDG